MLTNIRYAHILSEDRDFITTEEEDLLLALLMLAQERMELLQMMDF